jgi:hypothetical protein
MSIVAPLVDEPRRQHVAVDARVHHQVGATTLEDPAQPLASADVEQ